MQQAKIDELMDMLIEAHKEDERFLSSHPDINYEELDGIWKAYEKLGIKYANLLGLDEAAYYELQA